MSRKNSKQRGVSLVEVMLTLALSTLLLTSILAGRGSIRAQALFSDGMERIKETVLSVKSQANTSNSTAGNGSGVSGSEAYYNIRGRSITFTKSGSTATVQTVLCFANTDRTCKDQTQLSASTTTPMPATITYDGTYTIQGTAGTQLANNMTIIFSRSDDDATFSGYWYPDVLTATTVSNQATTALDTVYLQNSSVITLNMSSADGRKGTITIDPYVGTVTRQSL